MDMSRDRAPAGPTIDSSEFKRVMGHFATGVVIVTSTLEDGSPVGLTVNAFCSVSLVPQLVLVCIDKVAQSHDCILRIGSYAVNVLEEEKGETLSRRFADVMRSDRFEGVAYRIGTLRNPILESALAFVECRVTQVMEAGDHTIFVGEVIEAGAHEGRPLMYYRGGYGRFEP